MAVCKFRVHMIESLQFEVIDVIVLRKVCPNKLNSKYTRNANLFLLGFKNTLLVDFANWFIPQLFACYYCHGFLFCFFLLFL